VSVGQYWCVDIKQWALTGLYAVGIYVIEISSSVDLTTSYGEPRVVSDLEDECHSAIESDANQRARAVATEMTARIAKELSTAPDW